MSCNNPEIAEQLLAWMDGALPRDDSDLFARHVEQCETCQQDVHALRESTRTVAAALRRQREQPLTALCPTAEELDDFAAGSAPPARAAMMAEHVELCSDCRELVASLREIEAAPSADGSAVGAMPDKLRDAFRAAFPLQPALVASPAASTQIRAASPRQGGFRWGTGRIMSLAATIALVVGLGAVLFNHPEYFGSGGSTREGVSAPRQTAAPPVVARGGVSGAAPLLAPSAASTSNDEVAVKSVTEEKPAMAGKPSAPVAPAGVSAAKAPAVVAHAPAAVAHAPAAVEQSSEAVAQTRVAAAPPPSPPHPAGLKSTIIPTPRRSAHELPHMAAAPRTSSPARPPRIAAKPPAPPVVAALPPSQTPPSNVAVARPASAPAAGAAPNGPAADEASLPTHNGLAGAAAPRESPRAEARAFSSNVAPSQDKKATSESGAMAQQQAAGTSGSAGMAAQAKAAPPPLGAPAAPRDAVSAGGAGRLGGAPLAPRVSSVLYARAERAVAADAGGRTFTVRVSVVPPTASTTAEVRVIRVAVVVPNAPDEVLARIKRDVTRALGLNASRGDTVIVSR